MCDNSDNCTCAWCKARRGKSLRKTLNTAGVHRIGNFIGFSTGSWRCPFCGAMVLQREVHSHDGEM